MQRILKTIIGYCPHLQRDHEIVLEYHELHLSGRPEPDYKITVSRCDYIDECPMSRQCPIRSGSPKRP